MNNFKSPAKKDFLENPESKLIWEKCVETLRKAKELNTPESDKILIRAQLVGQMNDLEDLGIFLEMKSNLETKEYENPVTAVKYVAGQILSLLYKDIISTDEVLNSRNFDENKISNESNAMIIGKSESSPKMDKLMVDQQMLSTLEMLLDAH